MKRFRFIGLTLGILACFVLTNAGAWAGVVCRDEGWLDRNNDQPTALPPDKGGSGLNLKCYFDTDGLWTGKGPRYGHFAIYFNRCGSSCEDEQMMDDDVKPVAHFLECAWDLYLRREMTSSSLLFNNPLNSNWMEHTNPSNSHIPVWINKGSGGGGGSASPLVTFPAHRRIHDPITTNAIHEFGHVVVKGYGDYLGGGFVPLFNEGLPTFFEYVLRDDIRYPEPGMDQEECGGERFIDLSRDSLRVQDYCHATPFWHFIASFTLLHDSEYYSARQVTPACEIYLKSLDVPPHENKMRRIPGRDVIKAILEGLSKCYPDARSTPACTTNDGYAAYCAHTSTYSNPIFRNGNGCQPDDDLFQTDTEEHKAERLHARGELMMPLMMNILDGVFRSKNFAGGQNPRFHDGINYAMYRQYLEGNFLQPDAPNHSRNSKDGKFFIKSFGAHYHDVNISGGSKTVTLSKDADIPKWAYGVFYKGPCTTGTCMTAVEGWDNQGYRSVSAWKNRNSDTITIPSHPNFEKAVVIVTAFEGTYDLDVGYSESGGHYVLSVNP